ncbi:MAG: hypothetical protein C5B52_15315 [Bacteroidetes bacterium]|nr:MAG: hypothetical protein C5B52_15315 [Bacteroidota bacterium]
MKSSNLHQNRPVMESDELLFELLKNNDEAAFEKLYLKYYDSLVRYVGMSIQDKYYSEEIVQEFFMQLWMKKSYLKIQHSVSSYLYRSIRNKILNHFRDQSTYQKYFLLTDVPDIYYDTSGMEIIEHNELERKVTHLIRKMPERCREVYVLNRQKRFSIRKTAQILSRPVNTVDKQVRRAVSFLREHLAPVAN